VGSNKRLAGFLFLCALAVAPAQASSTKVYRNAAWAFAVDVPAGLSYQVDAPPNPNHGFRINITKDSFVWINADSSDDQTLAAAARTELSLWTQQGCTKTATATSSLGNGPAVSLYLRCPAGMDRRTLKRVRLIVAFHSSRGSGAVSYTIGMTSSDNGASDQRASAIMDAVRKGFRFTG
jgi:hypothetical protein